MNQLNKETYRLNSETYRFIIKLIDFDQKNLPNSSIIHKTNRLNDKQSPKTNRLIFKTHRFSKLIDFSKRKMKGSCLLTEKKSFNVSYVHYL